MTITYFGFQETVKSNAGEVLVTAGGRARFRLEETGDGVKFTPLSTAKSRVLNSEAVQRYLDLFNETQSTTTSDYTEKMRNASYVLAVIKLWIGQLHNAPLIDDGIGESGEIDPEFSAPEGDFKVRSHRYRERSRELVLMAKQVFRGQNEGRLFCEACDFDFGKIYGEPDFIEVHHRIPLCDLEPGAKTKLSDLAMVCSNCHRMLHRGHPWPTVDELRRKLTLKRKEHA
jgi:predicted HNH restriction endonuclease